MAASSENVRIRLNFEESRDFPRDRPRKCWFLVETNILHKISDFEGELCNRFGLEHSKLDLSLEGYTLPLWESISLLRDGDEVRVGARAVADQDKRPTVGRFQSKPLSGTASTKICKPGSAAKPPQDDTDSSSSSSEEAGQVNYPLCRKLAKTDLTNQTKVSETPNTASSSDDDQEMEVEREKAPRAEPRVSEPTKLLAGQKRKVSADSSESSSNSSSSDDGEEGESKAKKKLEEQVTRQSPNIPTQSNIVRTEDNTINEKGDSVSKKRKRRKRVRKKKGAQGSASTPLSQAQSSGEINSFIDSKSAEQAEQPVSNQYQWSNGKDYTPTNSLYTVPRKKKSYGNRVHTGEKHMIFKSDSDEESQSLQQEVVNPLTSNDSEISSNLRKLASEPLHAETVGIQQWQNLSLSTKISNVDNKTDSTCSKPGNKKAGPFSNVQVFSRQKMKKASFYPLSKEEQLNTKATHRSTIYENQSTAEVPETPMINYEKYPLLTGPPRTGDHIAYKILEMSENYSPELSSFKEAKVLQYNATANSVTLQLMKNTSAPKSCMGRFDVTIEEDGETLTNVATEGDAQVTLQWSSMVDARLIQE